MSSPPSKSTRPPILLVVDLQHGIVCGPSSWGPRSTPTLESNVSLLLSTFRTLSYPVIHVNHHSLDPSDTLSPSHPIEFAAHVCSTPFEGEKVLVKRVGSAFVNTELSEILDGLDALKEGKRSIVVVGMESSDCINNTVRHGADLGYQMVVVVDACAAHEVPDYRQKGKVLSAEETHEAAMVVLANFAKLTTTNELLEEIGLVA